MFVCERDEKGGSKTKKIIKRKKTLLSLSFSLSFSHLDLFLPEPSPDARSDQRPRRRPRQRRDPWDQRPRILQAVRDADVIGKQQPSGREAEAEPVKFESE